MSGVETKNPGTFTRGVRDKTSSEKGFDTDRLVFKDDELSYALGKEGTTRKKLEGAAGAILQYVGHVAFIAGTLKERKRCKEYIQWLLNQRRGSVTITNAAKRDDATEMFIPENCKVGLRARGRLRAESLRGRGCRGNDPEVGRG